jgi:sensor histidine kinase YesM
MTEKSRSLARTFTRYSTLAAIFIGWSAIYAQMIFQLGIHTSLRMALWDSLLANFLLAGACLVLLTILRYYAPGRTQYLNLLAIIIALTVLWYTAFRLSWIGLMPADDDAGFMGGAYVARLVIAFLVMFAAAQYSVLQKIREEKEEHLKRKADAEKLARDAELFRLQQQLQPHFLFNSLNSISALVGSQPAQARSMIQQLSEFLRGTLRRNEQELVPLSDELTQLERYLQIEKVRFGHRLETSVQQSEDCKDAKLPAMILQPLMENAIKYGLYDTTGDVMILLETSCANRQLVIRVHNPYDPDSAPASKGAGFGLASVQRRLYLLYGRNDLLTTSAENKQFVTTLTIPQA